MSTSLRVLFCDDSGGAIQGFLDQVAAPLGDSVEAATASSLDGFRARASRGNEYDVVISDLNFEHVGGGPKDGLLILREARQAWQDCEILLVTAYAGALEPEESIDLARAGLRTNDLFRKIDSDDPSQLWDRLRERLMGLLQARATLHGQVERLEREGFFHRTRALEDTIRRCAGQPVPQLRDEILASADTAFEGIIGQSFAMRELGRRIERAARRQSDVLVIGETGTGKELVARALHQRSPRVDGPFVKTDLAALSRELIPAELFGHERGAFTGAAAKRRGLIREAHNGCLFLDEIGNLGSDGQSGLLRILEDRRFRPLGAEKDEQVDLVVIAATNLDLEAAVENKSFRADLLERLYVVVLQLPPLRERREDIPLLATAFLAELRERFGVSGFQSFDADALDTLTRHPWPRNVRQLRNTIERLFSEYDDDTPLITRALLSPVLPATPNTTTTIEKPLPQQVLDGELNLSLAQIAKQYGEDAVREVIRATFVALRGPPDEDLAGRLFGGMKANTWRQFAFKRGLTYRAIKDGTA